MNRYSKIKVVVSMFFVFLVLSAEGFRVDRSIRLRRKKNVPGVDRGVRYEEVSFLERESTEASHAIQTKEKASEEMRAKLIVIAVVAASVICTVGFTFLKHQYKKWEVKTEEASLSAYQLELHKYTEKSEALLVSMKNIMENANGLSNDDKIIFEETLEKEAKHLASIQEEDIFEGESAHDQTTFLSRAQATLDEKSQKINLAYKTMNSVKKGVESVIALQAISAGGAAAGIASAAVADTTTAGLGAVMLIFSIVRNLRQLSNLSKQLAAAKATLKYATSDARNEGQQVYHHTKWGVCKVIGELHADIERQAQLAEVRGEEKVGEVECKKGDYKAVAECFIRMLKSFWEEHECKKFVAHEFRKGDTVEWRKVNDGVIAKKGLVEEIDPEGFYHVKNEERGTTESVYQRDLSAVDPTVGLVPPIRGHAIVTNMAVSNDCFEPGRGEKFKNFEMVCSRSYDLGEASDGETSRICELNKAISSKDDLAFVSDLHERCRGDDTDCEKKRAEAIAKADKIFCRATCESGKIKRHAEDLEKSRVLLIDRKNTDAREGDELDTDALYKLDLHATYVPKDGDWSSVMRSSLLVLPGWVEKSKYPKMSVLVPSFFVDTWRNAKEHIMPNVNLNALALTRGIDHSLVHFLASRWDLLKGDVEEELNRKRCGETGRNIMSGLTGPDDLRWLSVCQSDRHNKGRHINKFRKSLETALAKGQDEEHSPEEKMNVARLTKEDKWIGQPIVVFWREGETLHFTTSEAHKNVEKLSTQVGPCYLVGTLGIFLSKHKRRQIKLDSMSPVCAGAKLQLDNPSGEKRRIFIEVSEDDAVLFREAALVLRNQPCEKALGPTLPCKTSLGLKRKISFGKKGKKQFHLRLDGDSRVAVAKFVGTTNDNDKLDFHVHYPGQDMEDLELYPAQVVVAAIMSDPHIARNYRVAVGNDERSVLLGHCAVDKLSFMDEPMYDACIRLLLNEPHTAVDDSPGWSKVGRASVKLEAKHELLPDLRFYRSSSEPGLYAFMARKSERTENQPPIRHMRLTLNVRDPPDGSEACKIDVSCSEEDGRCLGAVVSDEQRHECNYYRVTTSFGDGLASDAAHGVYVWVKRRFAIEPCHISASLGGWKEPHGGVLEKWKEACQPAE